jgi:hypothetical protein
MATPTRLLTVCVWSVLFAGEATAHPAAAQPCQRDHPFQSEFRSVWRAAKELVERLAPSPAVVEAKRRALIDRLVEAERKAAEKKPAPLGDK